MRRLLPSAAVAIGLMASAAPASAERLVTSLSNYRVSIASNFTGTDLVLFGTIDRDATTVPRRGGYDVVVTVRGPRQSMVTRWPAGILKIPWNIVSGAGATMNVR